MKKVLILNRSISAGGIDRVGTEVAKFLTNGFDVYLCVFFQDEDFTFPGVKVIDFHAPPESNLLGKIKNNVKRYTSYRKEIKKIDPDIVIAQGNIPDLMVGLDKKFGSSYRSVLTVHNTLSRDLKGMTGKLEKYFLKLALKQADFWVADSNYVSSDFKTLFGVSNVSTIPNPISAIPRGEKEFNKRFIFTAGRLEKQKDFATLLRAFAIVAKEVPFLELIIAGEGSLLEELINLSGDLKIESRVKLIGYEKNLYPYLENCEFFVSSSLYEGMPMVVLQALSLRKAVISTDVPGTIEAVGNAGLFSPVGDAKRLAENMLSVLRDNKLKLKLENEAFLRSKKFSSEEIGKKWVKLLENL